MKLFSVGLNLSENMGNLKRFIDRYQNVLSSVYFSAPLGDVFYSRNELKNEYEAEGAPEKLVEFIKYIREHDIRAELALNNPGMTKDSFRCAKAFFEDNCITIDEIVCLEEYGVEIRSLFPDVELKLSFNSKDPVNIPDVFDAIVVGKRYLREKSERLRIIEAGKKLVLLVNNGCSFKCTNGCGNSVYCDSYLRETHEKYDYDYIYALQSIFPDEMWRLVKEAKSPDDYRIKISNRPLGLRYTQMTLDEYIGNDLEHTKTLLSENTDNYCLFCVMGTLLKHRNSFDLERIMEYKKKIAMQI